MVLSSGMRYGYSYILKGKSRGDDIKDTLSSREFMTSRANKTGRLAIGINIYPNPTSDRLHIRLGQSPTEVLSTTVLDLTGRNPLAPLLLNSTDNELDVISLPAGLYLPNIRSVTGETRVEKIVIQ